MPYVTPPTFSDDNVLSASQLKIYKDDIEYLYGVLSQYVAPTPNILHKDNADYKWAIRHTHTNLKVVVKWYIDTNHNSQVTFQVDYGSNQNVVNQVLTSPTNQWNETTFTVNLSGLSTPPTVGSWYELVTTATWDPTSLGNSALHVVRIYEEE